MSKFQAPKGTFDILPDRLTNCDWQASSIWDIVETTLNECSKRYGFEKVSTPIFEPTALFHKSTGETTDIVQKEMYTFEDKGKRSLTLRPEGTPSVLRSLIQSGAHSKSPLLKTYYLGPMFRYERPQAGRYRQFHQFGVEALGPKNPILDSEVIALCYTICHELSLKNLRIILNTLGSAEERVHYRNELTAFLSQNSDRLSKDSQERLKTNPLRVLDSKSEIDQWVKSEAPQIFDFLSPESKAHFEKVKSLLEEANIPFEVDPMLVRGIDYYSHTVFEILSTDLGAQSAVGGGGRYDLLYKDLGGSELPGVGFAIGMERLIQTVVAQKVNPSEKYLLDAYIVAIGEQSQDQCFSIMQKLREERLRVDLSPYHHPKKMKEGLKEAVNRRARFAILAGEDELSKGCVQLKHLESHEQKLCLIDELMTQLTK